MLLIKKLQKKQRVHQFLNSFSSLLITVNNFISSIYKYIGTLYIYIYIYIYIQRILAREWENCKHRINVILMQ